jgi:hypothetical protein
MSNKKLREEVQRLRKLRKKFKNDSEAISSINKKIKGHLLALSEKQVQHQNSNLWKEKTLG